MIYEDYKKHRETHRPSRGVEVKMEIEKIGGVDLDTFVEICGQFLVSGQQRHDFLKKLEELIEGYRI